MGDKVVAIIGEKAIAANFYIRFVQLRPFVDFFVKFRGAGDG